MISVRKIKIEKEKIISNCSKCRGLGCGICFGYCAFIDKMAEACIPVDYWFRSFDNFYGEENFGDSISKYINNISEEYSNGITICLAGERGRGKTFAACSILKKAILENYDVFYITLSDFVAESVGGNSGIKLAVKEFDFLVVDEVDQRFFPTQQSMELFGNQLENILRSRMQNKMPTILCSNSSDISQIFDGEFKKSFESLGSQFIKILPANGKDARAHGEKL